MLISTQAATNLSTADLMTMPTADLGTHMVSRSGLSTIPQYLCF